MVIVDAYGTIVEQGEAVRTSITVFEESRSRS
jgi:hypothetical protein